MEKRYCKFCETSKNIDEFAPWQAKQASPKCRPCVSKKSTEYNILNSDTRKTKNKIYSIEHAEEERARKAKYRLNNKDVLAEKAKIYNDNHKEQKHQWYENNKDILNPKNKQYYQDHKDESAEYNAKYYIAHKNEPEFIAKRKTYRTEFEADPENKAKKAKYVRDRRKNDPEYKMKTIVSHAIRIGMKNNGSGKNGDRCWDMLGISVNDFMDHISGQFEWWMTWENHGVYKASEWNDNDPTTWRWQLDHIIPHSEFHYTSSEDDDFKKCWALENLRPYNAKQNQLDGVSRVRHSKKI